MSGKTQNSWARAELLNLLSASATLAGLCITVIALMNALYKEKRSATVVDDALAFCAAAFLLCIYLTFWALRVKSEATAATITRVVDVVFLLAISAMTISGFIIAYTIW